VESDSAAFNLTRRVKVTSGARERTERTERGRKGVKIGEEESWLDALPPCVHALLLSASIGIAPAFFEEGETVAVDDRPVERVVVVSRRIACNAMYIATATKNCSSAFTTIAAQLRKTRFADP